MVYGAAPFAAFSLQQKMIAIAREEHQIDYPEYAVPVVPKEKAASGRPELREELRVRVPVEMIATMKACLTREARRRPTIAMLLKEGWLEGLCEWSFYLHVDGDRMYGTDVVGRW
jgi:serine/threonine-protein kinase TTK/MPS1